MSLFLLLLGLFKAPEVSEVMGLGSFLQHPLGLPVCLTLFFFSVFGGFYIIPVQTLIQERSRAEVRSQIIAANNIFNALFMVAAALTLTLLFQLDWAIPQIILLLSGMNLMVTLYIYIIIPEFYFRFICYMLTNIIYRLKIKGRDFIPDEGPAVLVCNHVSFVDWLILSSASPRPIRFVMHHSFLNLPLVGWIFKDAKVIPIAVKKDDPERAKEAFNQISQVLSEGELICIFPEGRITKDGKLNPFQRGIEQILKRDPVPVIPMALKGMWGSFFSPIEGKGVKRPFRRFWSRVQLIVGKPISPEKASASHLQEIVDNL